MTTIKLETLIDAPIERCFDLARSVDTHLLSAEQTSERAVAGRTSGLLEKGEEVTWEAIHFGIRQQLTIRMLEVNPPHFFSDQMIQGAFKSMLHKHSFVSYQAKTLLIDEFVYEVPFGPLGALFNKLILKAYMTKFLKKRNLILKQIAEAES